MLKIYTLEEIEKLNPEPVIPPTVAEMTDNFVKSNPGVKILLQSTILKNGKTFAKTCFDRAVVSKGDLDPKTGDFIPPTEFKSFEEIFGDLSDYTAVGEIFLNRVNLNSLKGFPQKFVGATIHLRENPDLKTLEHLSKDIQTFPEMEGEGVTLNVNWTGLETGDFVSEDQLQNIDLLKCQRVNEDLFTIEEAVKLTAPLRKKYGNFENVETEWEPEELEEVYQKLK